MSDWIPLILFFSLSIGFSFLCSILEAVLLSITPGFINREVAKGSKTGQLLSEYKEDIDRPLSAILTLNTIAHTVGAIGVGALAGDLFGENFFQIGPIELSYESIIATVMTLAILIISEIIPKTIGANNWQTLSGFTATTLRILLFILAPLVWVSQLITRSLKNDKAKPVLTRSDILRIALEGEDTGVLQQQESTIIKNILSFEKEKVRDIMTPRTVAFMLHEETTVAEYMATPRAMEFSRVPIFSKDKDHVTGMILKHDVMLASAQDQHDTMLSTLKRDVSALRDDMPLPELFKLMTKYRKHLYLVNDEYGNIIGLVTLEDLVEEMLGLEIMDETDRVSDMQELALKKAEDRAQNTKGS